MSLDISTLNKEQLDAVTTTDGPVLVLAGAGSGKTRVLTYRIAYILEQKLAGADEILAVTFTNKAANEMKERIQALLGHQGVRLQWMGTFHSICVRLLRQHGQLVGLGRNFTIYDPNDQRDVVKQAMDKLNISQKEINPRAILSTISSAKSELVTADEYGQYAQGYFQQITAQVYPEYQKILKENNAVDFDDMLMLVVLLFRQHPEILKRYQSQFKYVLVDEYQDTNHVQYLLVNTLAEMHKNICVVGDDDQSIYSFRGATVRNILSFERDYPEAKVIKLEQNYRSTKKILDAAFEVVSKNENRKAKKLWTDNDEGDNILLYTAENERDEANWAVERISSLVDRGVDPEDVAILYRTNAQSRALEESFIKHAVAYRIVGGVRFYERKEIKDILAYLRIIYNQRDDNSLRRIINVPRRGIGPKAQDELAELAQQEGSSMIQVLAKSPEKIAHKSVKKFALILGDIIAQGDDYNIVDMINFILQRTGYIDMLEDGTSENEARIENLKELISVAAKFADLAPAESLASFLEEVSLLETGLGDNAEDGCVTLMTVHAAKGLEFGHVFVVGMEEGLFPHSRVYTSPDELEEERRLAYVAITRAKEQLY